MKEEVFHFILTKERGKFLLTEPHKGIYSMADSPDDVWDMAEDAALTYFAGEGGGVVPQPPVCHINILTDVCNPVLDECF